MSVERALGLLVLVVVVIIVILFALKLLGMAL